MVFMGFHRAKKEQPEVPIHVAMSKKCGASQEEVPGTQIPDEDKNRKEVETKKKRLNAMMETVDKRTRLFAFLYVPQLLRYYER